MDRLFLDADATGPAKPAPVTLDITVSRTWLLRLVKNATAFISTRDVMPVLKCVQIVAADNKLTVIATDMEVTVVATTTDVTIRTEGVAVLPAGKLLKLLMSAEPNYVDLTVTGDSCSIRVATAWWAMRIPSGADFPHLPELGDGVGASVNRDAFHNAVEFVCYAAGKPADRPGLDAVDIRNGVATACDGSRFAQAPLTPVIPAPVTLPIAAANRIINRLEGDTVDIVVLDRHIVIRSGTLAFIVTKFLTPYPDLSATLLRPALANRHTVTLDGGQLLAALNRVRISADPDTHGVALTLANKVCCVAAQDPHGNTAIDTLPCDWTGKARVLTVHRGHLDDLINGYDFGRFDDERAITLHLGEDTKTRRSPILCRYDDKGTVGVIQQMYLDWADVLL